MGAAQQIENINEKLNWHWRNSMRTARFFSFDARASLPFPLLLVYARTSTLVLCIISLFIFRYLEKKGLTFPAALRALRLTFVGNERPGVIGVYRRKFTDWG